MVSDKEIKMIYNLVIAQQDSGLSIPLFCKKIDITKKRFYDWRSRFIPDSPEANPRWINVAGVVERKAFKRNYDPTMLYEKWLDYAQSLQAEES